jgi:pimeloyl-ACP methyl ester carboxylesterase
VLKKFLIVGAVVAAVVMIAVVAMVVWAWKNPLALYEKTTRAALQKSGMERMSMEAPAGELVWFEGGAGQELMLLHGAGDQAGGWAAIVPALIDDYRLVIPDLPGHGESDPAEGPLELTTVIDGVAAFLEGRETEEPVILVGHSMGAWVAMRVAERLPNRVERLVLINGGPLRYDTGDLILVPQDMEEARKLFQALRDPSSDPIPDFIIEDYLQNAPASPIGRLSAAAADMEQHLMDGRLQEFPLPVDIMWGESDLFLPVDYARRMEEELPAARLTLVPACGHHPANECPVEFARLLSQVLRKGPPVAEGGEDEPAAAAGAP